MKQNNTFCLEQGSNKFVCPSCTKKTLVRYLSTELNEYLPIEYGRCDREIKCQYHLNPYHNAYLRSSVMQNRIVNRKQNEIALTPIPHSVLKQTQKAYEINGFIINLLNNIPYPIIKSDLGEVIGLYQLGTISQGYRKGAITFPFIDKNNNIRAIQVKKFDHKNNTISTDFIHSIIARELKKLNNPQPQWLSAYMKQEKRVTCLFGEHLLDKYQSNPIGLVEAPKSAIYSTIYFGLPNNPKNILWLATYNLSSLNYEKCKILEGRKVILFPDLSKDGQAFEIWKRKANDIQCRVIDSIFVVSDLLEKSASSEERIKGYDLADYLIQMDWREFRKQNV